MESEERFEDVWIRVNDGELLSGEELESLRPGEDDSREESLAKGALTNRYLLLQLHDALLRILEVQMAQSEELERLAEAEDLPLGERLRMLEEHYELEDIDEAVMESLRKTLLGAD